MFDESPIVANVPPEQLESTGAVAAGSLCSRFVEALPITGASISVFAANGQQSTICASDAIAARAESLQFELGEGPHWESFASGRPVLCDDILLDGSRWPVFATGAAELGIRAMFAFPMVMGAAVVGVVDLYSLTAMSLSPLLVDRASALASGSVLEAVRTATRSAEDDESSEGAMSPALRREVHQATGMIIAQLDTTATDAFTRLRGFAFVSGRSISDVAADVVHRRLNFADLPE